MHRYTTFPTNLLTLGGDLAVLELISKEVLKLIGTVASTTGVSEDGRSVVKGSTGGNHISKLDLITGRHDGQVGDASQVGQIVASMVSGSVVTDQTGTVQNHTHGEVLDGHVVDHLIVTALHEGGVDAAEGLEALAGHTGREGDGVLLGNANVEGALGEAAAEDVHAGAAGHGGRDANDGPVLGGLVDEGVGKDRGEAGSRGLALDLLSGADVELGDAVHLVACLLGGGVALALLGLDVEKDGLVAVGIAKLLQNGDEVVQIMSIDGSDVVESQLLEEGTTTDEAAGILIDALVDLLHILGKEAVEALGKVAEVLEGLGHEQVGRVGTELRGGDDTTGTLRSRGETDLSVVIEDDDHAVLEITGTVHGLEGHTTRDGTIADDGNVVVLALVEHGLTDRHALSGGDTGGGMAGTEGIVFGFLALAETGNATELTELFESVASPGQHLVRVALMTDVPDDVVVGHVKDVVQGDGQLDDAEGRTEMAAGFGNGLDDLPPELVGELLQILHAKVLHVGGILDRVQDGLDAGAGIRRSAVGRHVQ